MQALPAQDRRWVLTSVNETLDATIRIIESTDRRISIFSSSLEPAIFNNERFLAAVKRLALGKPFVRIRILITNPARVMHNRNPFVQLARRLTACIEFRNVSEEYRNHREAFLIADENALIYRVDSSKWEGIADTNEPAVARRYLGLFNQVWNSSSVQTERRELYV